MSRIYTYNEHAETITQRLWEQNECKEFCDVILVAKGGKEISAHRSILAAASEYFNRMFKSTMMESTSKYIKLTSIDDNILQILVEFCYKGSININEDIVVELLKTANMLLLNNVVTSCENFLNEHLHPSNCLEFAQLAEQYCCDKLLENAIAYSLKHFMELSQTDEFLNTNLELLSELLKSDDLCVLDEGHAFHSLMAWITHDRNEREKYKAELLKLIRLPLLEQTFLKEHVKPICTTAECVETYTKAWDWQLSSDIKISSEQIKARKLNHTLMALIGHLKCMYIQYFCPKLRNWKTCRKELEYRSEFAIAVIENDLYIIGGRNCNGNILNSIICFNLKTLNFNQIKSMAERRAGCCAAVLHGFLYVMGGVNDRHYMNSVEKLDLKTHEWTTVAAMTKNRYNFDIGVFNEKLYAVGGRSEDNEVTTSECYDPILNIWKPLATMNSDNRPLYVAVANGTLYAFGKTNTVKLMRRYDPVDNIWIMLCRENDFYRGPYDCISFCDKVIIFYKGEAQEYITSTNKWEKCEFLNGVHNKQRVFSYSSKLLKSEFTEEL